jgi:predicted nuclease of restriction endonuclease-like (RecB) superfamily
MVISYWLIGREIVHVLQAGENRAEYGMRLINDLSNLQRGFHPNLGWSHYRILMRVDDPDTRSFYEIEAAENAWSVRELARQINSLFYERLLMSKDKREMLMQAKESKECLRPVDIIKDPYVLEFLDIPESTKLSESDLESAMISYLQDFLLELGAGFAFIGRQKRLTLDGDHPTTTGLPRPVDFNESSIGIVARRLS